MMPSVQDWCTAPLHVVGKVFAEHVTREGPPQQQHQDGSEQVTWQDEIKGYFSNRLSAPCQWQSVASINATPNYMLVDGQVARFRGMIQDMFDPEYYMDKYAVRDLSSGTVRLATSRYRDTAKLGPREEILMDSDATVNAERLSFYCVSVPGEAPWTMDGYTKQAPSASTASGSDPSRSKRSHDEDEEHAKESNQQQVKVNVESMEVDDQEVKKAKPEQLAKANNVPNTNKSGGSSLTTLNLPIANSKGQAVIVKLYDVPEGAFSLNDVVEFVGIVCLDPALANLPCDIDTNDIVAQFNQQETATKNPPPSLIPRLHVLHYTKLAHANPLLPIELDLAHKACLLEETRRARDDLHAVLTQLLVDDTLAADYLICNLISHVYKRRDVMCLGKYSLNLFHVPQHGNYSRRLSTIVQLLLAKSHYLPLTVDNLNGLTFVPKKDYHANRLVSGMLQLSDNTHLVVDETAMANGQLNADGVRNLTALGSMIRWQRVEYNFNYHQIEFATDVPCLVLSEGRSILPNDVQVMMRPAEVPGQTVVDSRFAGVSSSLDMSMLSRLRTYLTLAQTRPFELTDAMQKYVEEDFVRERRAQTNNSNAMSADDLHGLLVLARLMAMSRGEASLTKSIWEECKMMERQRKERVAHLPARPQPQQ